MSMDYGDAHLFGVAKNPGKINTDLPQSFVSAIIRMMENPTQKRFSEWDSIIAALNTNLAKPVDDLSSVVQENNTNLDSALVSKLVSNEF